MKSPSRYNTKDKSTVLPDESIQSVNNALDHSVNNLSENTLSDIARVRAIALNQGNVQARSNTSVVNIALTWLCNPKVNIGVSVAVAVMIAISVNYASFETIPELPLAMMATEVPSEDFAMLEELEFVTWLAENEQNALL